MKHTTQCYAFQRGKTFTVTAYFDEGGYYQFETPAPRLKNAKDWEKFKAGIAAQASKNFDKRVYRKIKKKLDPKPAPAHKITKLSSKKPAVKYTAKNNPLLRRR